MILFVAAVCLTLVLLSLCISGWCIGRKLRRMLERLYSGDWAATEAFSYEGAEAAELCGPLSQYEVQRIARRLEADRQDVKVMLLHFWPALLGSYEFRVMVDFAGTDAEGMPFSLQREGTIGISCSQRRGHWKPCITCVQAQGQPAPD